MAGGQAFSPPSRLHLQALHACSCLAPLPDPLSPQPPPPPSILLLRRLRPPWPEPGGSPSHLCCPPLASSAGRCVAFACSAEAAPLSPPSAPHAPLPRPGRCRNLRSPSALPREPGLAALPAAAAAAHPRLGPGGGERKGRHPTCRGGAPYFGAGAESRLIHPRCCD